MTRTKMAAGGAVALLSAGLLAACGSGSAATGASGSTVTIVSIRGTSGPTASLGVPGNNALQTEVNALNAKGGLLGKKIVLKFINAQGTPDQATSDARQAVLNDHAVALFGGVSSGDLAYTEQVAAKYKTILFSYTANDAVFTRTKAFTPYFFSMVPNTLMEPMAVARLFKKKGWTRIYTISPNYSYGHAEVQGFLSALKKLGVHYTLLGEQWPALGAPNFTSNISAILAAHPQAVFGGIYGSDLVTFTKEALGYNLFHKTHFAAQYGAIDMQTLGNSLPVGAIGFARGAWWTLNSPQIKAWAEKYHAKYGNYPSSYSMLGTIAFQAWVTGVKKAHSFSSNKLIKVLPGATISTLFGNVTIRACDHQAELPEYVGQLSQTNTPYPFGGYNPNYTQPASKILPACPTGQ